MDSPLQSLVNLIAAPVAAHVDVVATEIKSAVADGAVPSWVKARLDGLGVTLAEEQALCTLLIDGGEAAMSLAAKLILARFGLVLPPS